MELFEIFFRRLTKGMGVESESQIIRLVMCVTLVHNTRNVGCENEKPKQNKAYCVFLRCRAILILSLGGKVIRILIMSPIFIGQKGKMSSCNGCNLTCHQETIFYFVCFCVMKLSSKGDKGIFKVLAI